MAKYQILSDQNNCRLDKYIADSINNVSRSKIQSLIKSGNIRVSGNNKIINPAYKTKTGEEYNVTIPEYTPTNFSDSQKIHIIHEDEHLAVINKPAGLTVHKGVGTNNDTLVDLLLECYGTTNLSDSHNNRPGIVHRLDKGTSGIMLIAKTDIAHSTLATAIANRIISRKYIAIISGVLKRKVGTINANIAHSPKDKRKMHIVKNTGKTAITHYKLLFTIENKYSVIECHLDTGRTHQIRVHMKHLGNPIIGDITYGESHHLIHRQALHALQLTFAHPYTKKIISLKARIPRDITDFCTEHAPNALQIFDLQ